MILGIYIFYFMISEPIKCSVELGHIFNPYPTPSMNTRLQNKTASIEMIKIWIIYLLDVLQIHYYSRDLYFW